MQRHDSAVAGIAECDDESRSSRLVSGRRKRVERASLGRFESGFERSDRAVVRQLGTMRVRYSTRASSGLLRDDCRMSAAHRPGSVLRVGARGHSRFTQAIESQ